MKFKKLRFLSIFLCVFFNVQAEIKVSIITSLYKGGKFIEQFMYEIVQQTIFDQCELIIINANSPENEDVVIQRYVDIYPNIIYERLDYDPGIYGVWNMAINMAQGEYITNANVDDGLAYDCYEKFVNVLDANPDVDLVYADYYITNQPHQTFYTLHKKNAPKNVMPDFSIQALSEACLPNNHPMWRKSMHERYGYFDESFTSSGDYEMWVRAASQGAQFKRIPEPLGFFYFNPRGISTHKESPGKLETQKIKKIYSYLWQ